MKNRRIPARIVKALLDKEQGCVKVKRPAAPNMAEFLFLEQCKGQPFGPPLTQYHFASSIGRKWRFDFAFLEYKIGLEVDGGVWIQGAHGHPLDLSRNMEKQNDATLLGWRILRFTPRQVNDGTAIEYLRYCLGVRTDDALQPPRRPPLRRRRSARVPGGSAAL